MIKKISVEDNHTPTRDNYRNNPSFNGLGDGLIAAVQMCERYPMLNVTALDLSTAIVPRTIVETKESNGHAGFEAFRRESSGLIVNCLIPSFIVMAVAKLLQRPILGNFKKSSLVSTWANSDSIDKIHYFYKNAKGSSKEKIYNTFRDQLGNLSGIDGKETRNFADILKIETDTIGNFKGKIGNEKIHNAVLELVDIVQSEKYDSKRFKKAYSAIVEETRIAENIKFKSDKSFFNNNLEAICEDTVKLLRGVVKENITDTNQLAEYFKKAKKLVNWKSIGGLGIIIPLAISMQPINRWITRKTSGQKGAPIYKDFGENKQQKEMTPKEKRELLAQKFISIGSMIGVAGLSMFMDKPSLKMFQFKGLFPTMDQARLISTATFASRMGASEDKNELREATVRDIATFSSFYFLGDYVAKGIATLFEKYKPDVHLINRLKEPEENAGAMKKFWNWAKHTAIKSSDELSSAKDKRLRTICQLGNIVFSLIALGVLIPIYTRSKTNKKHAEELAKLNETNSTASATSQTTSSSAVGSTSGDTSSKASPTTQATSDDISKMYLKEKAVFNSFHNS